MTKKKRSRISSLRVKSSQSVALIDIRSYDTATSLADRVQRAKGLLNAGAVYVKGCSEFVCDVLGIPWEDANSLMGTNPKSIGKDNTYNGVAPGDVVGWKASSGNGHVAIYVGEVNQKFIDVPG